MSLISLQFLIFFILVLLVYYILPGKVQWIWLLLASCAFYFVNASWKQSLIFILFLCLNYAASLFIGEDQKHNKLIYRIILTIDILTLALFKYSTFFYEIIKKILGLFHVSLSDTAFQAFQASIGEFEPLHISYFLLIVVGYMTDVHWGKCSVQKNPAKMFLFSGFFPQMTSGPFVRYQKMENQLWGEKHRFSYETIVRGTERVLWGVFKKIVISARCAVIADQIYGSYEAYSGLYIILGTVFYAMQLYTDFSGLMDIVLGITECLGITFPENFNAPFFSRSIAEFWRRWHITLGEYLKDYVLFPVQRCKWYRALREFCKTHLGKDYKKKYNVPAYIGLLVAWFLIGLWHGGGWNYIFGVGIYMWFIIVMSELLSPVFAKIIKLLHINTECFSYVLFQRIRTFFLYMFGLSFFRAESLTQGFSVWKSAFSDWNPWILFDGSLYKLGLDRQEMGILSFGLLLVLVVSIISEKEGTDIRDWFGKQNYLFRLLVCAVLFACVITWGYYGMNFNASDFIYGRF